MSNEVLPQPPSPTITIFSSFRPGPGAAVGAGAPGVSIALVCVCWGRTQGGTLLGSNKRFISLVRQPSEEVVILRTSQIENIILIY